MHGFAVPTRVAAVVVVGAPPCLADTTGRSSQHWDAAW